MNSKLEKHQHRSATASAAAAPSKGRSTNSLNKHARVKRIAIVPAESEPGCSKSVDSETKGKMLHQFHSQDQYQLITKECCSEANKDPKPTKSMPQNLETYEARDGIEDQDFPVSMGHYFDDQVSLSQLASMMTMESIKIGSKCDHTKLPDGLIWNTFDLNEDIEMEDLKNFLSKNYPESEVEQVNYAYTTTYLKWKLTPPNYKYNWHLGIREIKSGKLVGLICGIPLKLFVEYSEMSVVHVVFICVNKNFRTLGLTPLLYSELMRRAYADSKISQLLFTSQKSYARDSDPITNTTIWAKDLDNMQKLIISSSKSKMKNKESGGAGSKIELKKLTLEKSSQARNFLVKYLNSFRLQPIYSDKEFIHWFLSEPSVETYVVEEEFGGITDLISFYTEEVKLLSGSPVKKIKCAHAFYTIATSMSAENLIEKVLQIAKKNGVNLFIATDIMNNKEFISDLNFQEIGTLNYYLQGIKCSRQILSSDIAFVTN